LKSRFEGNDGPMTLGKAAAAHLRLLEWCKACGHRDEPDIAGLAEKHGTDLSLRCSECGGRDVDAVVNGAPQ
jgi:hypothetical protein